MNGTQFWSGTYDHCTLPGCESAAITVTIPLTVLITDTDTQPQAGLPVYVFTGDTYSGYHAETDTNGEVTFTLPQGDYRFRSDLNGTQFWSGPDDHCSLPGCTAAAVTVTIPVTITVRDGNDEPYADVPLYAFQGDVYTGYHGVTDVNGQVLLTLPQGAYRFRADYDGVQFWSDVEDSCSIPGCLEQVVPIPGAMGSVSVTITYSYDALYRLVSASYDDNSYYTYSYDALGNRLTEESHSGSRSYSYDAANRLVSVDGVTYSWDANGNLISDGDHSYSYDAENRLTGISTAGDTFSYAYNGLGDRLQQSAAGEVTSYTLDLVSPLTQVLADGANSYLYGLARIGEKQSDGWIYHLADALGSVRQLVDGGAGLVAANAFEPFGSSKDGVGDATSSYGFAGEWLDGSGLIHLRARYFNTLAGRFSQVDPWRGSALRPMSFNPYQYAYNNPILYTDPSGLIISEYDDEHERLWMAISQEVELAGFPSGLTLDGRKGAAGILALARIDNAWWGINFTVDEALAVMLRYEVGMFAIPINGCRQYHLQEIIIEPATRKWQTYCSEGAWDARCLNGFWGYYEPIRTATWPSKQTEYLRNNLYEEKKGVFIHEARSMLTWPSLPIGNHLPSEWATLYESKNPEAFKRASNMDTHFSYKYEDRNLGPALFVILSIDQQSKLCGGNLCNITGLP